MVMMFVIIIVQTCHVSRILAISQGSRLGDTMLTDIVNLTECCDQGMQETCKIRWLMYFKSTICKSGQFKFDSVINWKPV